MCVVDVNPKEFLELYKFMIKELDLYDARDQNNIELKSAFNKELTTRELLNTTSKIVITKVLIKSID